MSKLLTYEMVNMVVKNWTLDKAHSAMEFSARHMMISTVKGHFEEFDGEINGDADDFSTMSATINIVSKSISTANEDRDKHLRSDDLFASETHPNITFKSKKVTLDGEDLEVVGDLTIRGVTKEVALKGEFGGKLRDPYGNDRFGFTLNGTINRQDFGVKWNMILEGGGLMVGDKINLSVSVEAFSPAN